MPVKTQQGLVMNSRSSGDKGHTGDMDRSRTRSHLLPTNTTKTLSPSLRQASGATKISHDLAMVIGANSQSIGHSKALKMISEVDETNIEEVLSLSDLSRVPTAFLTEIQQDQVYGTILQELKKKIPHRTTSMSSPPAIVLPKGDEEEQLPDVKPLSPHLVSLEDELNAPNDDDESFIDELSSTVSSFTQIPSNNDGYDTDIETEIVAAEDHDMTGKTQYRDACRQANIIPCSYFMAHIEDRELILRYHQFSNDDIRAIARTLSSNLFVERLLLDGNYLQQQAAKYIAQMIVTNDFITELSLADNRLGGGEGTKELCKMLTLNRNLRKINLSGNKFNELDVVQLVEAFEQNKTLRELDLSHNGFGEACGKILGTFISGNESLESIDLSWNNIRGRSAIDIAHGIRENVRLKRCNLEMNGFGPSSGQALADCIRLNGALEEFNISFNRLNTPIAFAIAQALLSNDSLQVLKIANNQINCDGVLAIFLCVKGNESNSLREVDFSHTVVTKETLTVCEDLVRMKNGKFQYSIGKVTKDGLQPNSLSECYTRTDEAMMKRFHSLAANVKAPTARSTT